MDSKLLFMIASLHGVHAMACTKLEHLVALGRLLHKNADTYLILLQIGISLPFANSALLPSVLKCGASLS